MRHILPLTSAAVNKEPCLGSLSLLSLYLMLSLGLSVLFAVRATCTMQAGSIVQYRRTDSELIHLSLSFFFLKKKNICNYLMIQNSKLCIMWFDLLFIFLDYNNLTFEISLSTALLRKEKHNGHGDCSIFWNVKQNFRIFFFFFNFNNI